MIGLIIWLIGLILTIWCVVDIFRRNIPMWGKLLVSVIVLITSWIGLLVYYFYARYHLEGWFAGARR